MRSSKTAIFGNSYATSKDLQKIVLLNFYCKLYSNQRNNLGNISKYYCFIRFHYPVACNEYEYTNVTNHNTDKKTQDMLVKFDFKISNFFFIFWYHFENTKIPEIYDDCKANCNLSCKQAGLGNEKCVENVEY